MIKIKVDGSVVSVQETVALYCGSQDVYTCIFTFDTGWERFSKSAVFRVNGKTVTILIDENGECVLPWELLVRSNIGQDIEVGMYGVSADAEILTSVWDSIGLVREGSELGNDAREPSAGVYEQVMANVQRVDEKVDNYNTEVQTQVQRAESAAAVALDSAESATKSAKVAKSSAGVAESAMGAVREALSNIPEGSTLVINDLTTGGAAAALSAEMGKVLGVRPNPNLLHNWYFGNPVNQRGQTEYTGAVYGIDRWAGANSRTSVLVSNDGINIKSSTTAYAYLDQTLEHPSRYLGKSVAVSVLIGGDFLAVTANIPAQLPSAVTTLAASENAAKTAAVYLITMGNGDIRVRLAALDSVVKAVKMELGDTQTLAHVDSNGAWVLNEIPDYGEELAKCQRYQMVYSTVGYGQYWIAVAQNATRAKLWIPFPDTMRATPAMTFDTNVLALTDNTSIYPISAVSVFARSGNAVMLDLTSSGLTAGKAYTLRASGSTKLIFDANL